MFSEHTYQLAIMVIAYLRLYIPKYNIDWFITLASNYIVAFYVVKWALKFNKNINFECSLKLLVWVSCKVLLGKNKFVRCTQQIKNFLFTKTNFVNHFSLLVSNQNNCGCRIVKVKIFCNWIVRRLRANPHVPNRTHTSRTHMFESGTTINVRWRVQL